MSEIHSRLKKLLNLAHHGIQGEKQNAQSLLATLMKKHGVTLDELTDEKKEMQWHKYTNPMQKKLLRQIMYCVTGEQDFYKSKQKKSHLGLNATASENLEINLRFHLLSRALQKELEICYKAFVQVNHLFPENETTSAEDDDQLDMEEMKRLYFAMLGMEDTPIRRNIALKKV